MNWDKHFLVKMKSGYAQLGDTQFLPGYCLLFAEPAVTDLNELDAESRADFLTDMSLLGDAIINVCQPIRINYGILGNSYPHLHAHLFPRYEWEPEDQKGKNVWRYPDEYWNKIEYKFDKQKHDELKHKLINELHILMEKACSIT